MDRLQIISFSINDHALLEGSQELSILVSFAFGFSFIFSGLFLQFRLKESDIRIQLDNVSKKHAHIAVDDNNQVSFSCCCSVLACFHSFLVSCLPRFHFKSVLAVLVSLTKSDRLHDYIASIAL